MPRHPPNALTTLNRSHCQCSSIVQSDLAVRPNNPATFYNRTISDAIDVFDKSALLELRRAAHLQLVFKTSFSRLNPVPRGQATVIRSSIRGDQSHQQRTIQSDKLPTYLQSFPKLRPARPSQGSSGLGSAMGKTHTWKPPDQSSLHNVCRTGTRRIARCKLLFLQRISPLSRHQNALVELSGIEPLTPCLQSRCSPS